MIRIFLISPTEGDPMPKWRIGATAGCTISLDEVYCSDAYEESDDVWDSREEAVSFIKNHFCCEPAGEV